MTRRDEARKVIQEAQASIARADAQLRAVRAREDEVNQLVWRLHLREEQNHFGESLMVAMARKT